MKPLDRALAAISSALNITLLVMSLILKICFIIFLGGLLAWGLGIIEFSSITKAIVFVLTPVFLIGDLIQWLFGVPTK